MAASADTSLITSDLELLLKRGVVGDGRLPSFCSEGRRHSGSGIEIVGFGALPLPIDGRVAAGIKEFLHTSDPGEVDMNVALDSTRVRFANPAWDGRVPSAILEAVTTNLAVPTYASCIATLCKLIIFRGDGSSLAKEAMSDTESEVHLVYTTRDVAEPLLWRMYYDSNGLALTGVQDAAVLSMGRRRSAHRILQRISLRKKSGEVLPCAAPAWLHTVDELSRMMRAWNELIAAPHYPSDGAQNQPPPRKVLLLLSHADCATYPNVNDLSGRDHELCTIVRQALQRCITASAYLAHLCVNEVSTREHFERDESDDSDSSSDSDWSLASRQWTLQDFVRLRDATKLTCLRSEVMEDSDRCPANTACLPQNALASVLRSQPDIDIQSNEGHSRTRTFHRVVLVIDFARDMWFETASVLGRGASMLLLAASISSSNMAKDPFNGTKKARLLLESPIQLLLDEPSDDALRRDSLDDRGIISTALMIFKERLKEPAQPDASQLSAFLVSILEASDTLQRIAALASHFLRAYSSLLISHDPDVVARTLAVCLHDRKAIASVLGVVSKLGKSDQARSLRAMMRNTFKLVLCLLAPHRSLLNVGDDNGSAQTVSSQKRKRGADSDAAAQSLPERPCTLSAVDVHGWLLQCGHRVMDVAMGVLYALRNAHNKVDSSTMGVVFSLLQDHGTKEALHQFVSEHLGCLISDEWSLEALVCPRNALDADSLHSALTLGIPKVAGQSGGASLLLRLATRLCADWKAQSNDGRASPCDHAEVHSGQSIGHYCATIAKHIPEAAVEPVNILLSAVRVTLDAPLGLRVHAPVQLGSSETVVGLLSTIAESWPSTDRRNDDVSIPTRAFLAIIIRHNPRIVERFIEDRFLLLAKHAIGVYIDKLFSDGLSPAGIIEPHFSWDVLERCFQGIAATLQTGTNVDVRSSCFAFGRVAEALGVRYEALQLVRRPHLQQRCIRLINCIFNSWLPVAQTYNVNEHLLMQLVRCAVSVHADHAALDLISRMSLTALIEFMSASKGIGSKRNRYAANALSRDLIPFGKALCQMFCKFLNQSPDAYFPQLIGAAHMFVRDVYQALEAVAASLSDDGDSVHRVRITQSLLQPVVRKFHRIISGEERVQLPSFSIADCVMLFTFLSDPRVGEASIARSGTGGVRESIQVAVSNWCSFAFSFHGRAVFAVATLADVGRQAANGSLGRAAQDAVVHLLEALISSEITRLETSIPPGPWARKALCSDYCSKNPRGFPSNCAEVSEFLADPSRRHRTFLFTNNTKLQHVVRLFSRDTNFVIQESEKKLVVFKKPNDELGDAVRSAAVMRRDAGLARLQELQHLLESLSQFDGGPSEDTACEEHGTALAIEPATTASAVPEVTGE